MKMGQNFSCNMMQSRTIMNKAIKKLQLYIKQAEAELGQAQVKLEVLVSVGVKVEVEIDVKVGIQLLARRVGGGWWVGGLKRN